MINKIYFFLIFLLFSTSISAQSEEVEFIEMKADSFQLNSENYRLTKLGDYFRVKNKNKLGLVDVDMNVIIEPGDYDWIYLKPDAIVVKQDLKLGLFDFKGNELLPIMYNKLAYKEEFQHYLIHYRNPENRILKKGIYRVGVGFQVEPTFRSINYLKDSFISFTSMSDKTALVKLNEEMEIDTNTFDYKYNIVDEVLNGYFRASQSSGQGLIDENENVIIPLQYGALVKFSDKYYTVRDEDGKSAVINIENDTLVPFGTFKKIYYPYYDGFHIIENDRKEKGLLNDDLEVIIGMEYEYIHKTGNPNLVKAKKNGQWGLLDYNEQMKIPFEYDEIMASSDGSIKVTKRGKFGYVTSDNKILVEPIYDEVWHKGSHGFFVRKGKYGLISAEGMKITECIFDRISLDFVDEAAYEVHIDDKLFYIDASAKCIRECPDKTLLEKYGLK